MPNYGSEEAVAIMDALARRQREQQRYAAENTANTIRGVGQQWGQTIGQIPETYMRGSKHQYETEESQQKINAARSVAKEKAEENAYLDTPDPATGVTPRMAQRSAASQKMALENQKAELDLAQSPELHKAKLAQMRAQDAKMYADVRDAGKPKEFTTTEKEGLAAAKEAARASMEADLVLEGGYDPTPKSKKITTTGFGRLIGLDTDEDKNYSSAQDAFVKALFNQRSDKNPTSSAIEFEKAQYFAQPGDTPEQIAAKNVRRKEKVNELMGVYGDTATLPSLEQEYAPRKLSALQKKQKRGASGSAYAAPAANQKPIDQMSIEELQRELGGK